MIRPFYPSLALLLLVGSCSSRSKSEDVGHWYFSPQTHTHTAAWSYEGTTGPEHWGELDPSYAVASSGREQSPIDIRTAGTTGASEHGHLEFHYELGDADFVNNGHTLQYDGDAPKEDAPDNWMRWGGRTFSLEQFHFHTPSEHTIDGVSFDAEIHLVHKGENGEVVVLAILANSDPDTAPIIRAEHGVPGIGERGTVSGPINPSTFLPLDHSAYHYQGSFTTPPCTEGVEWLVLRTPMLVNAENIAAFRALLGDNNRPVQPHNGRMVSLLGE